MSFKFRAQAALDLRLRQEEAARRGLGAARAAAAEAARAAESAASELTRALREAREEELRATDTVMTAWRRNWLAGQRRRLADLQQVCVRRRAEESAAAARLMEAARQVCALAKLRDRLWDEHRRQENLAEQRELNWLGSLRYVMNNPAGAAAAHPARGLCGEEVKACQ